MCLLSLCAVTCERCVSSAEHLFCFTFLQSFSVISQALDQLLKRLPVHLTLWPDVSLCHIPPCCQTLACSQNCQEMSLPHPRSATNLLSSETRRAEPLLIIIVCRFSFFSVLPRLHLPFAAAQNNRGCSTGSCRFL